MKLHTNPLRTKVTALVLAGAIGALVLVMTLVLVSQWQTERRRHRQQLEGIANALTAQAAATLLDEGSAPDGGVLKSLTTNSSIRHAHIVTREGEVLARYSRLGLDPDPPPPVMDPGIVWTREHVALRAPVTAAGRELGSLYLVTGPGSVRGTLGRSVAIALAGLAISVLVLYVVSRSCTKHLFEPIASLSQLAAQVSASEDYSLRAHKRGSGELLTLAESFNGMLEQIQQRDTRLQATREELQQRVEELRDQRAELRRVQERQQSMQERLGRSEKMESVGRLAGGVAHDLNNILGPLVGYPDLVADSFAPDAPERRFVAQIKAAALRAAAVIQDLLILSRQGNVERAPVQLERLVTRCLASQGFADKHAGYSGIRVETDLDPDAPGALGSDPHLTQVVMNLLANALEAIGDEGVLTVSVHGRKLSQPHHGYETVPPGPFTVLAVSDTGPGLEPRELRRIFEPFYTRKKMGRTGSGLGLAVVYGVVKDLHGYLDVTSRPGLGTTFEIFLPAAVAAAEEPAPDDADLRGSERILIVDDEEAQRVLATELLSSLGYDVTVATGGRQALEYLRHETPDLVILDMVMEEDFDGLTTFRHARRMHPDLRCLIASGFSESQRVQEAMELGAGAFVAKPYTLDTLARTVRRELDCLAKEPAKTCPPA